MTDVFSIFENFTLSDSFDIFVVSLILYRFLSTVQGTRAVQVLVGTATMATLYWMSLTFELYSLNWVLENFFEYFFIILIILFQDQIRTSLAMLGNTTLFSKKKNNYLDAQIEEVIMAARALSREKTGALMVLEKDQGLLNYSTTGTKLDARIHSDILYTIFQSSSPMHDGAVIIFNNRIQAAGCFLPLSKSFELERKFGTRHRAAIGISEVSDAFVIVVSEETGKINVCINGKMIYCKDETELRKQIRVHLYGGREDLVTRKSLSV